MSGAPAAAPWPDAPEPLAGRAHPQVAARVVQQPHAPAVDADERRGRALPPRAVRRVGHPQRPVGALARLACDSRLDELERLAVARAEHTLARPDPERAAGILTHAHHRGAGRARRRVRRPTAAPQVDRARLSLTAHTGPARSSRISGRGRLRRGDPCRDRRQRAVPRSAATETPSAVRSNPDPERAVARPAQRADVAACGSVRRVDRVPAREAGAVEADDAAGRAEPQVALAILHQA